MAFVSQQLLEAVTQCDSARYRAAIEALLRLTSLAKVHQQRSDWLARLRKSAPTWADEIARRVAPHDASAPPGDASRAWMWRQLNQELERRARIDLDALQRELDELTTQSQAITAKFVVNSTWAEQRRRRYSLTLRHALNGWLQTVTKPGFETGVRSTQLKAQARQQLAEARGAVPVWIMPLARVAESFDFSRELFDVVIIDEASQCDVLGILPMMIGKEVVIVGDHEQVSPSAVGQNLGQIQQLITQYLEDIPSAQNYDGRTSIYDLAKNCFGTTIRLVEHFRCVPEIISFSNALCYGDIKPLRECQGVVTLPFVVEHRVLNATSVEKVNAVEALEVASLVVAITEQPEYHDQSIGVISLVGEEQAYTIDTLLRRHLPETEYSRRRILCGNAAEFQGDERHVMFLSIVDSSDGTPLSVRQTETFKQRFNVAASRAQNQMWVVHSLNPETELQANDLRRRLIKHAQDPKALGRQVAEAQEKADSEFERLVSRGLSNRGYRLEAQWAVGAFPIDIVVFGEKGKKVAIECDGD